MKGMTSHHCPYHHYNTIPPDHFPSPISQRAAALFNTILSSVPVYPKPFISLLPRSFVSFVTTVIYPIKPSTTITNSAVFIHLDTWRREHLLNNLIDRRRMTSRTLTVLFHPSVSLSLSFLMIPVASQTFPSGFIDRKTIIPSHSLPRY